ncbi:hypothetical protein QWY77_02755 [Thalassotalea ponticola]|uniref:hypothetical protein n=1 Tax=Thalassotalea ponticola TaxID=1523392 RepID=UPI0025B42433|nr:hypothetical protein [Thalassotalea ponticola]MDN3651684.1 hypothetical protein [Thalassotalea ponticola]
MDTDLLTALLSNFKLRIAFVCSVLMCALVLSVSHQAKADVAEEAWDGTTKVQIQKLEMYTSSEYPAIEASVSLVVSNPDHVGVTQSTVIDPQGINRTGKSTLSLFSLAMQIQDSLQFYLTKLEQLFEPNNQGYQSDFSEQGCATSQLSRFIF